MASDSERGASPPQVEAADSAAPASRVSRLLFLAPAAVFAGLALIFAVRLGAGDPSRVPSALLGQRAPALDLPALPGLVARDGHAIPGLPGEISGRVTLVNFWASWCPPCREEHPVLMALSRDPRLVVVGVNHKDGAENARRFLGAFGNPFAAVGVDSSGRASIDWGVSGVPETFALGPDGAIRAKHAGALTDEAVRRLLAAAEPPAR